MKSIAHFQMPFSWRLQKYFEFHSSIIFRQRYLTNTEVESKTDLLKEVFDLGKHLLLVVNILSGWCPTYVGYTSPTPRRVNTTRRKLTQNPPQKKPPPTEDSHHPERKVTNLSTSMKI